MKNIKTSYDLEVDAMYIDISEKKGDVVFTESFSTDIIEFGSINIDFNFEKKIVGIEILNASKVLKLDKLEQKI